MATHPISTRDISRLREVLDLTRPDHTLPPVEATFRALELIRELVGCDAASFQEFDSLDFQVRYMQYVDDEEVTVVPREELDRMDEVPGAELLKASWWTSDCSLIERTGGPVVTTTLTWQSEREWAQDPVHLEYLPFFDEAVMGFPTSTFRSLRILLPRETGPGFGEREKVLLELLLPHLRPLLTAAVEEGGNADPEPLPLTVRQQEILGLVRLGMPNRRIGRILGITEATVRKHLENVFERLGVRSRTAAVAVAFGEEPTPDLHAVGSAW